MDLTPFVKITASQYAARQMLDMIREGAWKTGEQLPTEKDLVERLKVGRSTIREALQILATLNVVQATAGHGTFVKAPTTAEIFRPDLVAFLIGNSAALELLEAREMIEPQCVRLACIRGTQADFDAVERVLDQHDAANLNGQPVGEFAANFHVRLAAASHNPVAAMFMRSILELLTHRGRRIDHIPHYRKLEAEQHRAIFDIVRAREPERAADAMLRHIVESAKTYDTGCHPL
jgi:DNA-binding FadR family transcriptional regulator